MSKRFLPVLALIVALFAASWWTAGQVLRWRDLQLEAERLRAAVSSQIGELRRLPRRPPSLPDEQKAQEILMSWTGRLPQTGLVVRASPSPRNPQGLRWNASFEVGEYQQVLDELARLHAIDPVAVTSVSIRRREGKLAVNFEGYIATEPRPQRGGDHGGNP